MSGSDLGSSNTSLEKDADDGGLKEWGREESAELQWCYPSLLSTSVQEDFDTDGQREEAGLGGMGREEDRAMASIKKTLPDHTDIEDSAILNPLHGEEAVPRKKVTLMGGDFPLPLSPSKQSIKHLLDPNQKPIRTSGLDCGDLDPFVQSDSFVYLAVSAKPALKGDGATVTEFPARETKLECLLQHMEGTKTHFIQPNPERDVKMAHLGPHKPEEGDFLCTDSFVYLAAPACLLLGPAGSTSYSGRCVNFCCFSDEQISICQSIYSYAYPSIPTLQGSRLPRLQKNTHFCQILQGDESIVCRSYHFKLNQFPIGCW